MGESEERFLRLWGEVVDLSRAAALASWDQETVMPRAGAAARAQVAATLAGVRHAKLVAPELQEALERCAERAEPGSALAADVRLARRVLRRVRNVPERLAREKAEAAAHGHEAWAAARARADFALFRPALERLVALAREEALCVAEEGQSAYDACLDEYEPGARESEVARLFLELEGELRALVARAAGSSRRPDPTAARGDFPVEAQVAFARAALTSLGFDLARGRIDAAPHPFCTGFSRDDVRLTWRADAHDFRPAFFGLLHEGGHGLYEQGLPVEGERRPFGEAVSLGVHESQSRLWENLVGRSPAFWRWCLPRLKAALPGARTLEAERLLPLLHSVEPSLIRVEADQGTYDLHVLVRFELERALLGGTLAVADLPAAWNEGYRARLGRAPRDASEGVLQDIHWSMGAFGYFPTYTLGNLIAAQLFAAARRTLGDLDAAFARGEFAPLLGWLRENVHAHGSLLEADELVRRATGRPLSPRDYLDARTAEVREYYG